MKILDLHLEFKWYDLIRSGVKKEEYREIKPYWIKKLCDDWSTDERCSTCVGDHCNECRQSYNGQYAIKNFDFVVFHRGYTKESMIYLCRGIEIGMGKKEWGCPDKEMFKIRLGIECYKLIK